MAREKKDISLKERASIVNLERKLLKLIPKIMACIVGLVAVVYVTSALYSKFSDFTISINKYHYVEYGLSLSETRNFENPTSSLNCKASELITNISGKTLDKIDLGSIDGNDSGDNYLCYTFYCKNAGTQTVSFDYAIEITEMTLDIEKAVRVRLITNVNGEDYKKADYARVSSTQDENGEFLPEEGTTPFVTKSTVLRNRQDGFKPDDVMKYTVVVWLEGDDPDCIDDIIGGEFKIDMKFNILSDSE